MNGPIIIYTGVLIEFLLPKDKFHSWATYQLSQITAPIITCEAVIAEAYFLAQRIHNGQETVLKLIKQGHIAIPFSLSPEIETIEKLMQRYASVPISLADAYLFRMSEIYDSSPVSNLDSDFKIYRKHRNQNISVIMPDDQ